MQGRIHSGAGGHPAPCGHCSSDAARPFVDCVAIRTLFNGAGGNCLWRHRGMMCSHNTVYGSASAVGAELSLRAPIPQTPGGRPGTRARVRTAVEGSSEPDPAPDNRVPQLSLRRTPSRPHAVHYESPAESLRFGGISSLAMRPGTTTDTPSGPANRILSTAHAGESMANAEERGPDNGQPAAGSSSYAHEASNSLGHEPLSDAERGRLMTQAGLGSGQEPSSPLSSSHDGSAPPSEVVHKCPCTICIP